jgi:hypothetical protein
VETITIRLAHWITSDQHQCSNAASRPLFHPPRLVSVYNLAVTHNFGE